MKYYTLTIVFNKECDKVLMCWHEKQRAYNFIGGSIKDGESKKDASYRELLEETGITKDDIQLFTVRQEIVFGNKDLYKNDWDMYITYGVLNKGVTLKEEKNRLCWLPITSEEIDVNSMGYGNCRVFLNEALALLRME